MGIRMGQCKGKKREKGNVFCNEFAIHIFLTFHLLPLCFSPSPPPPNTISKFGLIIVHNVSIIDSTT